MNTQKRSKLLAVIFLILAVLGITSLFVAKKYLDNNKKEEIIKQEPTKKINYADKIPVENFIINMNKMITDNKNKYQIDDKYLDKDNKIYYYGIFEDIGFYVIPTEYTGSKKDDITKTSAVFYKKDSKNESLAKEYIKYLFKTNLPTINNEEIDKLMKEAIEKRKLNQAVDENNGLFISYDEQENNIFYIITRNYKQ